MAFDRLQYQPCEYEQRLKQSVNVLPYRMYFPYYESRDRCTKLLNYPNRVDNESVLKNIMRPVAKYCVEKKYTPNCMYTKKPCVSTFNMPNDVTPTICKVVKTNMHPYNNVGYVLRMEKF